MATTRFAILYDGARELDEQLALMHKQQTADVADLRYRIRSRCDRLDEAVAEATRRLDLAKKELAEAQDRAYAEKATLEELLLALQQRAKRSEVQFESMRREFDRRLELLGWGPDTADP